MNVEQEIHVLIDELARTWNARDGDSFCRLFDENADYVTGSGVHLAGRGSIHESLFRRADESPEFGQVSLATESITRVGSDAAVILCRWRMNAGDAAHASSLPERSGIMTIVTQRSGKAWRIIALQNTDRAL
jgi:uncharacterized protein (TIGR02246 family)